MSGWGSAEWVKWSMGEDDGVDDQEEAGEGEAEQESETQEEATG